MSWYPPDYYSTREQNNLVHLTEFIPFDEYTQQDENPPVPPQKPPDNTVLSPIPRPENDNLTHVITRINAKDYSKRLKMVRDLIQPDYYHRFVVKSPVYSRTRVIDALTRAMSMFYLKLTLFPLYFHRCGEVFSFLAKDCIQLIEVLCCLDMVATYPNWQYIEFEVRLNAVKLDFTPIFKSIVSNRLDEQKKYLDLSSLHSVPELAQILPDPGVDTELLRSLLLEALKLAPQIISICLADNSLSTVSGLCNAYSDACLYARTNYKPPYFHFSTFPLRVLDLSYNKLDSATSLFGLKVLPITELHLHHNPFCGKCDDESYVSILRKEIPKLVKLDGLYFQIKSNLPPCLPNFIVEDNWRDPCRLANQFLDHFFSLYDRPQRSSLRGLYHQNAYFSLSVMHLPNQRTSSYGHLDYYMSKSRNLLNLSDMSKIPKGLWHTSDKILEVLQDLPRTEHDPYTFTVDVVRHEASQTVLTVTGVFREVETVDRDGVVINRISNKVSLRHFMRTFILYVFPDNECQILNDILYISNSTTNQAEEAFRFVHPKTLKKQVDSPPPKRVPSREDKRCMLESFINLTEMRGSWASKCLDDVDWDLSEALTVFIELHKLERIPSQAFKKKWIYMPSA